MHIRIFEPKPSRNRYSYWVVVFPDKGEPQVQYAESPMQAEAIAADLATQHGCQWKYMPNYEDLPHWLDEKGNYRIYDRLELVHVANGRGQLNTYAGTVRLTVEVGDIKYLLDQLQWSAELWAWEKDEADGGGLSEDE